MELRFTKRNQTLIAHISGEIYHHTSGELRLKIDRALEQISGKNIIFCFREVTFMDSSGIGMMIGRYKQIQSLGGRVAIACASPKVADIIALSGLGRLLPDYDELKAALAYVQRPQCRVPGPQPLCKPSAPDTRSTALPCPPAVRSRG